MSLEIEALRFLRGLSVPVCSPLLKLCRTLALVSVELLWGTQRGFKELWSGALSLHVISWLLNCGTGYKEETELGSAEPRWQPEQREGKALIPPLDEDDPSFLLSICVLLPTWLLHKVLVLISWRCSAREVKTLQAPWESQGVVWCDLGVLQLRDSRVAWAESLSKDWRPVWPQLLGM